MRFFSNKKIYDLAKIKFFVVIGYKMIVQFHGFFIFIYIIRITDLKSDHKQIVIAKFYLFYVALVLIYNLILYLDFSYIN